MGLKLHVKSFLIDPAEHFTRDARPEFGDATRH
jgi:hypothetical protein